MVQDVSTQSNQPVERNILHRPIPKSFQSMVKPIGSICNLNCSYCYYLEKEKLYKNYSNHRMDDKLLEIFIRQQIESQQIPKISFVWQGGEPSLLGIDYFEKVVKLQLKYGEGKEIINSFQTNGTNITDGWCRFFKDNNFLVGLSIDGPEKLHNRFRKYKNGSGSFTRILNSIKSLKYYGVEFNTLTVVNQYNVDFPLEIYDFLKEQGSRFIQFIPLVEVISKQSTQDGLYLLSPEDIGESEIAPWSVESKKYGDFLIAIFDQWVKYDVGDYFVPTFDATLANWIGVTSGMCAYNETCGNAPVIEFNGDIYPCDHYVYPSNLIGNLKNMSLLESMKDLKMQQFGLAKKATLPEQCRKCRYHFACHGECPKNRIALTQKGEKGLNYFCEGLYKYFSHVTPYMEFMSREIRAGRSVKDVRFFTPKQF